MDDYIVLSKFCIGTDEDDKNYNLPLPADNEELETLCDSLGVSVDKFYIIDFHFKDVDIEYIYDHSDIYDMEIYDFLSTYDILKRLSEEDLSYIGKYMSSEDHNLELQELLSKLENGKKIILFEEFLDEIKNSMGEKEKQMFERFYNWIPPEERRNMVEAYYLTDEDEIVESEEFDFVCLK